MHSFLLIVTLIISAPIFVIGQTKDQRSTPAPIEDFRRWARTHAHDIEVSNTNGGTRDLEALRDIVGNARVVGLGEPFHGAHEPLAMRNRFIRYLVTDLGFTAVALETGLSKSKRLYDHVLGNTTESDSALVASFSYGFGELRENMELVAWLRSYNANHASSRRVRLYGIDLTGQDFPLAYESLDAVFGYLDRVDPPLAKQVRAEYADVVPNFRVDKYPQLSAAEKDRITGKVQDLIALLRRKRVAFTAAGTRDDYEWALRQAVNAAQDDEFMRLVPSDFFDQIEKGFEFIKPSSQLLDHWEMRELAIADNLSWVLEREGPQGRILFFAHDGHLQGHTEQPSSDNPLFRSEAGLEPAGMFMRSRLGSDVVVIGTYFGSGVGFPVDSRPLPPDLDGIDGLLGAVDLPSFIIDLRKLPQHSILYDRMSHEYRTRSSNSGETTTLVRPTRAFDAILYIDRVSPALASH